MRNSTCVYLQLFRLEPKSLELSIQAGEYTCWGFVGLEAMALSPVLVHADHIWLISEGVGITGKCGAKINGCHKHVLIFWCFVIAHCGLNPANIADVELEQDNSTESRYL